MGRARLTFTTLTPIALAAVFASACAGASKITTPPDKATPPLAAAAPVKDPMLLTLGGQLANKFVRATQPGEVIARLRIDTEEFARDERTPVNLALAIDTSGSMEGDAIAHARDAALQVLDELDDGDRLAVVVFHSTSEVLVPSTEISADEKQAIAQRIGAMNATGTTDMAGGLNLAIQQLAGYVSDQRISRLVLLSDGVPNDETPIVNLVDNARQHGVTITALGLGVDYNETLLANIAQRSGGSFHYVEQPSMVTQVFRDEVLRLERVVARNMTITLNPGPGIAIKEVIGLPVQRANRRTAYVHLGDLSEGQPRDVFVRLHVGSCRDGANVELLDSVLSFTDAVENAGTFQRRVFLAARATSDSARLRDGRNPEIEQAVESTRAAVATVAAVANARAGNIAEAQRILQVASPSARDAANRYHDENLAEQADEMDRLRTALPALADDRPAVTPVVGAGSPGEASPDADAPVTIRSVHGHAMRTLQGL